MKAEQHSLQVHRGLSDADQELVIDLIKTTIPE